MNRVKQIGAGIAKAAAAGVLLASAGMLWTTPAAALPVSGQGTWETTLQARDLNGDTITDAFYDTALNITWLRNANVNGPKDWNDANNWANNLSFGGYTDWRLPTMIDTGAPGCDVAFTGTDCGYNVQTKSGSTVFSEMAHLYYVSLGNKASYNTAGRFQTGYGLTNTGDFQNLMSSRYFSDEYLPSLTSTTNQAWDFRFEEGIQYVHDKERFAYAMAVRPGDVAAAVPEPQSVALVLMGLVAAGVARRRRQG